MHRAVVLVIRVSSCALSDLCSDCSCIPSVTYTYPPLNISQYYVPPQKDHAGDMDCDCNTVMYKYEVRIPWRDPSLTYLCKAFTWRVLRVRGPRSTREILNSHIPRAKF